MVKIKDVPTNRKDYYNSCQVIYKLKYNRCTEEKSKLEKQRDELYEDVCNNKQFYLDNYKINIDNYTDFRNNQYKDGMFFNVAKRLFLNKRGDYTMIIELYDLFTLAKLQRAIYNLDKQIHIAERILSIKYKGYNEILKAFFKEVHRQMILNGCAYYIGNKIGYLCINRCKTRSRYKMLDFEATSKLKAKLLSEGKRLWNKEEAEYCERHGYEYNGVDYRVFKTEEYYYEIALLYSHAKGECNLTFESSDYRHAKLRGKTYDDMIKDCNNDVNKICNLDIDIKAKLTLCNKVDKMLYSKFIRNENQDKYNYTKINR